MCKSLAATSTFTTTPTTITSSISLSRQRPMMGSGIKKYRQATVPKMAYYNQSANNMQKFIEKEQNQRSPQKIQMPPIFMVSPPPPPVGGTQEQGQHHHHFNNNNKNLAKGINNLERTCWKNYANSDEQSSSSNTSVSSTSASLLSSSSITSDSNVSFVSAASNLSKSPFNHHQQPEQQQQQQQQKEMLQPPVPLPRLRKDKLREMNYKKNNPAHTSKMTYRHSIDNMKKDEDEEQKNDADNHIKSKDLIYLDDFEWEDFDPLNKNARPLPMLTRNMKISTLPQKQQNYHNSNNLMSSNDIFTRQRSNLNEHSTGLLKPPPLPKSLPPPMLQQQNNDDDFELLRKYGLDQFTLPANSATSSNSPCHTTVTNQIRDSGASGRNNWTTFE